MANYNSPPNKRIVNGQRYGYLTPVRFITSRNAWECTCICGKIVYRLGAALLKYKYPNCGCKKGLHAMLSDQRAHKNAIIATYVRHAKSRGHTFELSFDEAVRLFESSCHYCDKPPSNERTVKPSRRVRNKYNCNITTYYYSGIDRVDSSKGYTVDNCVPCCFQCNWSKSNCSLEEWRAWVISLYQKMFNDQSKDVEPSGSKQETPPLGG